MPPAAPVVDRRERVREGLSATAWRAGHGRPSARGHAGRERSGTGSAAPTGRVHPSGPRLDLNLDRRHPLALICMRLRFGDAAHRRIAAAGRGPRRVARRSRLRACLPRKLSNTSSCNGASSIRLLRASHRFDPSRYAVIAPSIAESRPHLRRIVVTAGDGSERRSRSQPASRGHVLAGWWHQSSYMGRRAHSRRASDQ